MGKKYLIDTNIIIAYLDDKLPLSAMEFMHGVVDEIPNISVINKIELLRFKTNDSVYQILREFVNESNVLGLVDEVINTTIIICREHRIKLPDGIIAATAINFNFTLLTRNVSDFKNINGLETINPWDF